MATTPPALPRCAAASFVRTGLSWRAAVTAVATAMLCVVALLYATVAGMVSIWARSDTFMHGFLIAPIALWLALRMRDRIAPLVPTPAWSALPLVAIAGLAWSAGALAVVDVVTQFALVAMLVLAVPSLMGWSVARMLMFPLGFLFFMVPFGEFLLPPLMAWTADFTVAALRASGVPVYQDGLQFVLPTGRWSVVEACSGVRYLIASLVAGSLFAYLSYRSAWRRAAFVVASIVVPIVANWVRAYLIVMLGHLSNNTIAVGVDHLIYGWLFFGIVLLLLFWVGSLWSEDSSNSSAAPASVTPAAVPSLERRPGGLMAALPALAAFAALVGVWPLAYHGLAGDGDVNAPTLSAVEPPPAWVVESDGFNDWAPRFVGASATSNVAYRRGSDKVALYVAYYRNQREGHKAVSAGNVLVGSEDSRYRVRDTTLTQPGLARGPAEVREAVVMGADGTKFVTWRWYWVGGRTTARDVVAKTLGLLERVTGHGDDGAIVVASARADTLEEARRLLASFVNDVYPGLELALARTQAAR